MDDTQGKYILKESCVGQDSSGRETKHTLVLQGEILEELPTLSTETISLRGVNKRAINVSCSRSKVAKLTNSEANLLMAITKNAKRYNIYMEKPQMEFGKTLKKDSEVLIEFDANKNLVPGIVKEIGPHKKYKGVWFTVELKNKSNRENNGDGQSRETRTVALDKIHSQQERKRLERHESNASLPMGRRELQRYQSQISIRSAFAFITGSFRKKKGRGEGKKEEKEDEKVGGRDEEEVKDVEEEQGGRGAEEAGAKEDSTGSADTIVLIDTHAQTKVVQDVVEEKTLVATGNNVMHSNEGEVITPADENESFNLDAELDDDELEGYQVYVDTTSNSYLLSLKDLEDATLHFEDKKVEGEVATITKTSDGSFEVVVQIQKKRLARKRQLKSKTIVICPSKKVFSNESQSQYHVMLMEEKENAVKWQRALEGDLNTKEEKLRQMKRYFQKEKQDHASTKKTLQTQREQCESTLKQLQTEQRQHASTQADLERERRQRDSTQADLEREQRQRESTQAELEREQRQRESTQADLERERRQRESTQADLEREQRQRESTQADLEREQRQRASTQADLEREQRQRASTQVELEREQRQRESTQALLGRVQRERASTESELQSEQSAWKLDRSEIELIREIGRGAWGVVMKGKFRGTDVAVKQIHGLLDLSSGHYSTYFQREMNIASQCRHPCLLQLIGVTNDDQDPLFVTELLDTSLRADLERLNRENTVLQLSQVIIIALDVAKALNYLHLKKPNPIIHRDISSANVLLWKRDDVWRAKVSDYGSANFMQYASTIGPGTPVYSAPEARSASQSPKIDVYSYGVLVCEMSIGDFPVPEERERQVSKVTNQALRSLIVQCVNEDHRRRPSMMEIISRIENDLNQNTDQ